MYNYTGYQFNSLKTVGFYGTQASDVLYTQFQDFYRETTFKSSLIAISKSTTPFTSHMSGYLGLLPYSGITDGNNQPTTVESEKETNFMYKLKADGKIDHLVFSLFVDGINGNYSSIKFGSYDKSGIAPNEVLNVYKTHSIKNWNLVAYSAIVNNKNVIDGAASSNRYINFEPGVPYLYLPSADFTNVATEMKTIFQS